MSRLLVACKSAGSLPSGFTSRSLRASIPVVPAPNSFYSYANMSSIEPRVPTESVPPVTDSSPEKQDRPTAGDNSQDDILREVTDTQPEIKQPETGQSGTESSRKEDEGKAKVGQDTSCVICWTLLTFTKNECYSNMTTTPKKRKIIS